MYNEIRIATAVIVIAGMFITTVHEIKIRKKRNDWSKQNEQYQDSLFRAKNNEYNINQDTIIKK